MEERVITTELWEKDIERKKGRYKDALGFLKGLTQIGSLTLEDLKRCEDVVEIYLDSLRPIYD